MDSGQISQRTADVSLLASFDMSNIAKEIQCSFRLKEIYINDIQI